ncbi:flavin reductase family protein [Streptomyces muensis]|uniref:Flavin reductase family protein n=1 Tax=Streptomyces muensis TaxID=1077944 RepID=A0A9X1Q758_STRM4|nr:flavin reductase family protein [Streptomyces muensis]MCF1600377.1 flavin reductase family protein [Streptomyces muensis]
MAEVITPDRMRRTLAGFSTGLAVVAAEVHGTLVGMPANSLVSVSLDPPLVSLSFAHTSTTWPELRRADRWGISVLGVGQEQILRDLRRPASSRFDGIEVEVREQAGIVRGAIATIEAAPWNAVEAGDHTLVLLEVLALERDEKAEPLVFFGGQVRTLSS